MVKVLFFRTILGRHILLERRVTKKRKEYRLRIWRER